MHPIIFSTPMVQAILEGRKTQTRRICKRQPLSHQIYTNYADGTFNINGPDFDSNDISCPYGKVGDTLWVKETWQLTDNSVSFEPGYVYKATDPDWDTMENWKWKPSIFMPKKAARIFLKITNIRVERLQDISKKDAIAEGIKGEVTGDDLYENYAKVGYRWIKAKDSYKSLWQKINSEESWNQNPWVWVIEFKNITK